MSDEFMSCCHCKNPTQCSGIGRCFYDGCPRVEVDPHGIEPGQPGAKLDAGKTLASSGLIDYFPNALKLVAEISTFGAEKYALGGWRSVEDGQRRYENAGMRHRIERARGEFIDAQSGKPHQGHEVWCALAALELALTED